MGHFATTFEPHGDRAASAVYASLPTATVRPKIKPVPEMTAGDLKDAHIELMEMSRTGLSTAERQLFASCKEILQAAADDRIPLKRSEAKKMMKTLKKIGKLIDKGRPIPHDVSMLYKSRYSDIVTNIKAYVARKSESYARGLAFSRDPKEGISEICDKASLALFWGVYVA